MFVCFVHVILRKMFLLILLRDPTQVHSLFHYNIAPFINSLHERLEHAKFTLGG